MGTQQGMTGLQKVQAGSSILSDAGNMLYRGLEYGQRKREFDEQKRQFDLQYDDQHMMNMIQFAEQQRKQDWQKKFRDALAGRGRR